MFFPSSLSPRYLKQHKIKFKLCTISSMTEWTREGLKERRIRKSVELSESINWINRPIAYASFYNALPHQPWIWPCDFLIFQWHSSNLTYSDSIRTLKKCEFCFLFEILLLAWEHVQASLLEGYERHMEETQVM